MFSDRLKRLRAERHISQVALGKDLFVSQQAVAKWELGTASPNPEMITKIAKYFDVSTDFLLGNTEERKETPTNPPEAPKTLDNVDFALYGATHDLTKEEKEDVLSFVNFLKSKRGE